MVALAFEYVPAAQLSGVDVVTLQYSPGMQSVQVDAPASDHCPGRHAYIAMSILPILHKTYSRGNER